MGWFCEYMRFTRQKTNTRYSVPIAVRETTLGTKHRFGSIAIPLARKSQGLPHRPVRDHASKQKSRLSLLPEKVCLCPCSYLLFGRLSALKSLTSFVSHTDAGPLVVRVRVHVFKDVQCVLELLIMQTVYATVIPLFKTLRRYLL